MLSTHPISSVEVLHYIGDISLVPLEQCVPAIHTLGGGLHTKGNEMKFITEDVQLIAHYLADRLSSSS